MNAVVVYLFIFSISLDL